MEDFRDGNIKSFKEPGTTVAKSKSIDMPMFENPFHLSAHVPKQNMNAPDLIEATLLQSLWISNFRKSLADTTISKVLAKWFKNTLIHSTKDTRTNPSYRPALANIHDMHYQEFCTPKSYKKKIHGYKGKDQIPYGYPVCLTGEAWDAYAKNPYDLSTRKEFLNTISLNCIEKKKDTKITPPYALALEKSQQTLDQFQVMDKESLMQGITMDFFLPQEFYCWKKRYQLSSKSFLTLTR